MWQTLRIAPRANTEFTAAATELVRSTARVLIWTTSVCYLAWYFFVVATQPFDLRVWVMTLVMLPIGFGPLYLLRRHLTAGLLAWHVGLAGAITFGFYLFGSPEITLFYTLLPFMAIITFGWQAGVLAGVAIVATALGIMRLPGMPFLPGDYLPLIIGGGLFGGLMGWASVHALFTVVHWSLFSFAQAQRNMDEARLHRAQMARVLKDLDQAYYRLERANAALAAAWAAADEAEHFKTEFVTNVSHELRTPLNLIVGFSEVMLTAPESYEGVQLPGPYRSDVNAIYRSAQHLLALVDDVLDLARIEVGKINLAREEVDLAGLVTDAVAMVSDYVATKGLELRVDILPDLPPLWIDRLRIRQVLLNLLVNAARFTERGWISVSVARQGEEMLVKVTDTGRGIPAQDLPKVFEEFRTTEQPTSTWHSGTGLGLPISKRFVELHRGRMGVESQYGQGTTFWFALPCVQTSTTEPVVAAAEKASPLLAANGVEGSVVVVHEDAHIIAFLQHYVSGYRLIGVTNMEEGLALAGEIRALAVVAEAGTDPPNAPHDIPVVTCPLPSGQRIARALGAVDFLVKPVSSRDLLAAVSRVERPVRRVLIVDEEPELARLFRRMLRSRIAVQDCLEAYDSEEALRLLQGEKPDLVLLSLEMPRGAVGGVLEHMAIAPDLAGIPVILTSAHSADHVSGPMTSPIQVHKPEGFHVAEVVVVLEALLNALAPSWRQLGSTAPGPARGRAGSPVSAETPSPPESMPTAVP